MKEITHAQSSSPLLPPSEVIILGAGHFGRLAIDRLTKRYPSSSYIVVDRDKSKLQPIMKSEISVFNDEAISFLSRLEISQRRWVVPAVPVHVAFLWLLGKLREHGSVKPLMVPEELDLQVPNPFRTEQGTLYCSYATFRCPDNCSEPGEICTYTGKPRPGNLFEDLAKVKVPSYRIHVVRSWQLAPGVGGYTIEHLSTLYEQVLQSPGHYLIATSCRCHGVVDALLWIG